MSEPEKKDFDSLKAPPSPANDDKVLHPLFGTCCRTETYLTQDHAGAKRHVHMEAYMDDPVAKTWAVSKVVIAPKPSGLSISPATKTVTHVHKIKSKASFKAAVEELAAFEKECRGMPAVFQASYPDAPAMGCAHFRAFAEREGYVFDIAGKPHARPQAEALPPGFSFAQEDIDAANKNLKRPAEEFDNNGPASKAPNAHFLLDQFTRAAHGNDYETSMSALRVLNILDRFVDQLDRAHAKLSEYCEKYKELGFGDLITDAESALNIADASVRQLKAYGVDTMAFESFVLQCRISCYVLHAEGLYDLMNNGKGDFDANEKLFKSRVNQALEHYKKIDSSEDGLKALQNMIVQAPEPKVPEAISHFITRYKTLRTDYRDAQPTAKQKPKAPKP